MLRSRELKLARPWLSHSIIFPGIVQHLGVLEDLLRYGLDVVELFDHVVVDQLFVDVTAGLRLAACDAGPRPGATVAICGFRAWPVLHFEKERE